MESVGNKPSKSYRGSLKKKTKNKNVDKDLKPETAAENLSVS